MYRLEMNYISRDGNKNKNIGSKTNQTSNFSVIAAAAYRTGTMLIDHRTGKIHDYRRKQRIGHTEIVLPTSAPSWAVHADVLWNAVESAEIRKDARLANEFIICLPHGLTPDHEIMMVRELSQEIVKRHNLAIEFSIHGDNPKQWDGSHKVITGRHAHLLMTTRPISETGLSKTKAREFFDRTEGPRTLSYWRERWATIGNKYMQSAGLEERWDHRSLSAQRNDALSRGDNEALEGLDRQPGIHIGALSTALERKGIDTFWGNINRMILAKNAQRRLWHERKNHEEALVKLMQQLDISRKTEQTDKVLKFSINNDNQWALFETTFLQAAQFDHGLSLIQLLEPLAALKSRFVTYMDLAHQQDITPEAFAITCAKGFAAWHNQSMEFKTENSLTPAPTDAGDIEPTI